MAPYRRMSGRKPEALNLARQRHRRPDGQRRPPQHHQGVAVEEGHGAVGHVVAVVPVGLGRPQGDRRQSSLGAPDRLGCPGGSRGEEQEEEVGRPPVPTPPPRRRPGRRHGRPGAPRYSAVSTRSTRSAGTPVSSPASRAAPSASVTSTRQSVRRTSPARASPRRVGLMPTTTAPDSAAAPSQNRYSGTLPSSTPTWGGSRSPNDARSALRAATGRHRLGPGPRPGRPTPRPGGRRRPGRPAGRRRYGVPSG